MTPAKQILIVGEISFLQHLSKEELIGLIKAGREVVFSENDIIIQEGDEGNAMYLLLSGSVEIFKQNKTIATRGAGEVFGEMAMIESKPRSASVRAITDTILFEIGKDTFDRFLAPNTKVLKAFLHTISDRCRVDLDIIDAGYLELYKSEERYRTIVETISDIVLQIDPDGTIDFVNSAISLLGYSPEDLVGKPFTTLMKSTDEQFPLENLMTKRVGARATSNIEVTFKVNEDSPVSEYFQEMLFLVDAHGIWNVRNELVIKKGSPKTFLGTLCIARDYTERKKKEDELKERKQELEELVKQRTLYLEQAIKDAQQASRAKSEFLSKVSHELRTPLNAIMGFSHILETSPDITFPEKEAKFLNHISNAGEHLLSLITEIMDLSRIESDNVEVTLTNVDVYTLLRDLLQFLSRQAQEAGIHLHNHVDTPVQVRADATKLRQVLLNLLSNAIKYNKENGDVHIDLQVKPDQTVEIAITDTGAGISEENYWKVFEPFQRLGREYSDIEGTGIGLTISKRLMELMEGKIGFTSTQGQGTRFFIELPEGDASELSTEDEASAGAPPEPEASSKLKVLYVEDNVVNIDLFQAIISQFSDITLITALNAEEGIQCAKDETPDLIFMDLYLPKMDGYDALKILRHTPETEKIPVIALSAMAMKEDIEKGLEAGFNDYLTKPIQVSELKKLLAKFAPKDVPLQ